MEAPHLRVLGVGQPVVYSTDLHPRLREIMTNRIKKMQEVLLQSSG